MPVHERALGILLPRPDVQGVERREPEAVGALEEVEELSHELRRAVVSRIPSKSSGIQATRNGREPIEVCAARDGADRMHPPVQPRGASFQLTP